MEEIWREVDFLSGYEASDKGNIRSVPRVYTDKTGKVYHRKGKQLKLHLTNGGYLRLQLANKSYSVSRLVAFAFPEICGEYFEGAEIDHINTIRTDNRPENLRWVDRSGNLANPITKQRMIDSHLGKKTGSKTTSKWVIKLSKNNEILHFYRSTAEAERETGVKSTNISACCLGKRESAGDYIWKYA